MSSAESAADTSAVTDATPKVDDARRSPELQLGVAICTLNEEVALPRLLSRLLQGVEARDRADLLVVADAGSTDSTVQIAERFRAPLIFPGRGRGVQLRAAADELIERGADVLLFLHADSIPRTGSVEVLRAAFEAGADAAAMRQSIVAEGRRYRLVERAANGRARRGMVYGDSGLAVTPSAYRAAGGFPAWPLFEDVALSKALRKQTKIQLIEEATLAISPRRWEKEGLLRCTTRNLILRGLFECGVPARTLARAYRPFSGRRPSEA